MSNTQTKQCYGMDGRNPGMSLANRGGHNLPIPQPSYAKFGEVYHDRILTHLPIELSVISPLKDKTMIKRLFTTRHATERCPLTEMFNKEWV